MVHHVVCRYCALCDCVVLWGVVLCGCVCVVCVMASVMVCVTVVLRVARVGCVWCVIACGAHCMRGVRAGCGCAWLCGHTCVVIYCDVCTQCCVCAFPVWCVYVPRGWLCVHGCVRGCRWVRLWWCEWLCVLVQMCVPCRRVPGHGMRVPAWTLLVVRRGCGVLRLRIRARLCVCASVLCVVCAMCACYVW